MTTAVTDTLRSVAVDGEVFFREFLSRNGANTLRKVYEVTAGVIASCMAAGIILSASLQPELKPLARDLVSHARPVSITFGSAPSDAKCRRRSDLLITRCPPLSDAALKSLIDEAIVPAMVDSFLTQKGLIPAGRDSNKGRLVSDGATAHDSGEKA